MFQARNTLNMIYDTPPGLAVLPEYETTVERATAIKRAAFLALIRKRRRLRNHQSKKKED